MNLHLRRSLVGAVLGLLALLLLTPKFLLVRYISVGLWGNYSLWDWMAVMLQDAALLLFWCWLVWRVALRAPTAFRFAAMFLLTGVLLAVLTIDARARQLWLQPINLGLIKYTLEGLSDLTSGYEMFFRRNMGFGLTLRRLMVYQAGVFMAVWAVLGALALLERRAGTGRAPAGRGRTLAMGICGASAAMLCVSAFLPRYMYDLEDNIVVHPLVGLVHAVRHGETETLHEQAQAFDRQSRPAREALSERPRRLLADVEPFENVIVVMLESVRWQGLNWTGDEASLTPYLKSLAGEGLLAKCYTTLPHTAKAYFSVLTGRHPYPAIEMRESTVLRNESVFWALKEKLGMRTYCFSSMSLQFENVGGLIRSCGFDDLYGVPELQRGTKQPLSASSFGITDEAMIDFPTEVLAAHKGRFVAFYNPIAAHYPYVYPGKSGDRAEWDDYVASLVHFDAVFQKIMEGLRTRGLLENTLVVIAGDHGESFGEHGSFAHNNSLYEEEITVPLLFWSDDGRLRSQEMLVASQVDIPVTLLDLMGLHDESLPVQGVSLLRHEDPYPVYVTSFFADVAQARIVGETKWLYMRGSDKLFSFNLSEDPDERSPVTVPMSDERQRLVQAFRGFNAYQRLQFPR